MTLWNGAQVLDGTVLVDNARMGLMLREGACATARGCEIAGNGTGVACIEDAMLRLVGCCVRDNRAESRADRPAGAREGGPGYGLVAQGRACVEVMRCRVCGNKSVGLLAGWHAAGTPRSRSTYDLGEFHMGRRALFCCSVRARLGLRLQRRVRRAGRAGIGAPSDRYAEVAVYYTRG